ncbi:putative transporter [Colletotrichum sp. SAR11_240]|nr:putative transporter [Colletotrichum sp. SAR11_240]
MEPSSAHIEEGESFELKASSTHPDQKKSKHRHSSLGHHESHEWKAAERRVVRKLDMTLLPVVWVLYMFNYLDRNNIAQARLDNFEEDLGLHGTQFNVAVSILNVGYMLAQLPSNMILTRVIILCANHTAYGFNNFFPTIVSSMHLGTRTITLVLTAPPYLFGAAISFIAERTGQQPKLYTE